MARPSRPSTESNSWEHHQTDRLVLDRVAESDVDEWHRIHADPDLWTHFPSGRHSKREQTAEGVHSALADWEAAGLGYWSIREELRGPIIGCGGCRLVAAENRWNLYYRLSPSVHGRGYASEVARAAVNAANHVDPAVPVIAYMLEHNVASWRVAERIGLVRVWVGPDEGNPDPDAVRFVYADRPDVAV